MLFLLTNPNIPNCYYNFSLFSSFAKRCWMEYCGLTRNGVSSLFLQGTLDHGTCWDRDDTNTVICVLPFLRSAKCHTRIKQQTISFCVSFSTTKKKLLGIWSFKRLPDLFWDILLIYISNTFFPLKHSRNYIYHMLCQIFMLPTLCIYVFLLILTISSDYFLKRL
jgi:hypothetical protein